MSLRPVVCIRQAARGPWPVAPDDCPLPDLPPSARACNTQPCPQPQLRLVLSPGPGACGEDECMYQSAEEAVAAAAAGAAASLIGANGTGLPGAVPSAAAKPSGLGYITTGGAVGVRVPTQQLLPLCTQRVTMAPLPLAACADMVVQAGTITGGEQRGPAAAPPMPSTPLPVVDGGKTLAQGTAWNKLSAFKVTPGMGGLIFRKVNSTRGNTSNSSPAGADSASVSLAQLLSAGDLTPPCQPGNSSTASSTASGLPLNGVCSSTYTGDGTAAGSGTGVLPVWRLGQWGNCSAPCGGGVRVRDAACVDGGSGEPLEAGACTAALGAVPERLLRAPCNSQPCGTAVWQVRQRVELGAFCAAGSLHKERSWATHQQPRQAPPLFRATLSIPAVILVPHLAVTPSAGWPLVGLRGGRPPGRSGHRVTLRTLRDATAAAARGQGAMRSALFGSCFVNRSSGR